MKIYMPGRIVDGQVGGNTTYARNIRMGLRRRGHVVESIPAIAHPVLNMLNETKFGFSKPSQQNELIHYVADTGPLLKANYPSVVTVHGIASRWIDVARSKRADYVWKTRVRKAIELSDAIITVSNSSADDIAAVYNVDKDKINVIPHGIDFDLFATPSSLSAETQARIDKPYVLYLGNIEPRKNLVELVKAFQSEEIKKTGLELIIAGKPAWDFDETMQEIQRTPNVKHLGFVSDDDRRALMQNCELFIFPSLYEGFGFPVLEALAAGAVVLSSDRGSLKEVAGPALTLESLDAEGIKVGIIKAIEDEDSRKSCLLEGAAWAQQFSWDKSVEEHIKVYKEIL